MMDHDDDDDDVGTWDSGGLWAPFHFWGLQLIASFLKRTLYSEKDMDSFNAE